MTQILLAKAKDIQKSKLSPYYMKEYLKTELLSVYNQDEGPLNNKKVWILWFELLTILNITKNHSHCKGDIPNILKRVRLFYSDIKDDYWSKHISELHKKDYSGLEENGLVVVATNEPAVDMHILDTTKIPSQIYRVNKAKEDFELGKLGQKVDTSTEFPLEKFKFVNISYFKNGVRDELTDEFKSDSIINCIKTLRELYEQVIVN